MSEIVLPERWSYSSLSTWTQCPRKWYASYVDKIRGDTIESVRGTLAHEALELLAAVDANERTLDMLMDFTADVLAKYDGEFAGTELSNAVVERVRNAWHLERWTVVPATEIEADLSMTTPGGNIFRGYADRLDKVNGKYIVTDYKSGRPSKWALGSVSKQMGCYVAMLRARGDDASIGRAVYLGAGSRPANIVRFHYSDEDVAGILHWIDTVIGEIKWTFENASTRDEMTTGPSPLCGWCPIANECADKFVKR